MLHHQLEYLSSIFKILACMSVVLLFNIDVYCHECKAKFQEFNQITHCAVTFA